MRGIDSDWMVYALALVMLVVFAFVAFFIGVVIAYVTGWMLENWLGWCAVDYDVYRAVAIAVIVFAGATHIKSDN